MRIDPLNQLILAGMSLTLGALYGIVYDVFRILRIRSKLPFAAVVTDVFFCIIVCSSLFLLGYSLGGGQSRAYMAIIAALGAAIYFALLSRSIFKALNLVADILLKILQIIVFPCKLFAVSLKKLMFFFKNAFYYKKKWYTINWVSSMSSQHSKKTTYRALKGTANETEKGRYYY